MQKLAGLEGNEKPPAYNPSASAPTLQPAMAAPPPGRPVPELPAKGYRVEDDIDALKAQAQHAYNPNAMNHAPSDTSSISMATAQHTGQEWCHQCGVEHMAGERAKFCFNCGHPTARSGLLTPQTSCLAPPPPPLPYDQEAGAPLPRAPVGDQLANPRATAPLQQPGTFVVSLPAEVRATQAENHRYSGPFGHLGVCSSEHMQQVNPGDVMKVPVPPPFPQQGQITRFRVPDAIPHNRLLYVPLPTGPVMPGEQDVPRGTLLH